MDNTERPAIYNVAYMEAEDGSPAAENYRSLLVKAISAEVADMSIDDLERVFNYLNRN